MSKEMIFLDNRQKLVINGGRRLEGELSVGGAKNSALPLLSAEGDGVSFATSSALPI